MNQMGLVAVIDSFLLNEKRISGKTQEKLLKLTKRNLSEAGFEVFDIGLIDLLQKKLEANRYVQLSVTEGIEESKSEGKILYKVVVTTATIWIEDVSLPQSHLEKTSIAHYGPYSEDLVIGMLNSLMVSVCARLKVGEL